MQKNDTRLGCDISRGDAAIRATWSSAAGLTCEFSARQPSRPASGSSFWFRIAAARLRLLLGRDLIFRIWTAVLRLRLLLSRDSIFRFWTAVLRLRLLKRCNSICRFRVSALRLRLLLGRNSICRFRVAAVTIVTGFFNFFQTLWSCVCFLWRPRNS